MTSHKEGRPSVLSRDRLEQWALSLLPDPWDCPFDIGASFRSDIRQLGWASGPLWAVFPLIAGGIDPGDSRISPYVEYIRMALTPGNSYSFDDPTPSTRQIVFEQTVYGYGLLCLGDRLLELLKDGGTAAQLGEVLGLKAKPRRPKWMRKIDGWKE